MNGLYFFAYAAVCFHVLYLNLYLKRAGMSGTEIGTLWAIMTLTGVFLVPAIGSWFDRAGRPASTLAWLSTLSGAFFLCYALPVPFAVLAGTTLLLALAWSPVQPFINSLVLDEMAADPGSPAYGEYRKWGSLGFAVAGGVAGALTRWLGIGIIFPGFLLSALAIASLAPALGRGIPVPPSPRLPGADAPARGRRSERIDRTGLPSVRSVRGEAIVLPLLKSPGFIVVMLVNLLLVLGHLMGWTLRAIYLDSIGLPDFHAGLLIVAPTLTEIVVFARGAALLRRFGIRRLVFVGAALTGLRWALFASVTSPVLLYFTEIAHGIGFPMFVVGLIEYLRRTVPGKGSATAQVLVFSSANGIGAAAGGWLAGVLLDLYGPRVPLYAGAVVSALAGVTHALLLRNPGKGSERDM